MPIPTVDVVQRKVPAQRIGASLLLFESSSTLLPFILEFTPRRLKTRLPCFLKPYEGVERTSRIAHCRIDCLLPRKRLLTVLLPSRLVALLSPFLSPVALVGTRRRRSEKVVLKPIQGLEPVVGKRLANAGL